MAYNAVCGNGDDHPRNHGLIHRDGHWTPPVLGTVAVKGEGIGEVIAALDRHFAHLESTGTLLERRRGRLRERVREIAEERVRTRLWSDEATRAWVEEQLPAMERGEATPFGVADHLLERSAGLVSRGGAGR